MAERVWETLVWACWTRVVERAWRRCSLSGLGGMGGAGAGGPDVLGFSRATSNGSDRRSGGGCFRGGGA